MQKNNQEFKIKFRGVRGSHPVCSKNHTEYGGNTSCIEIKANGKNIILDGGTGIIGLGNDLISDYIVSGTTDETRNSINTTIFFSHSHIDHIQGLPFFKPAYIKSTKINIFGIRSRNKDFEQILSETIFDLIFPLELKEMSAQITINNIHEAEVVVLLPDKAEPQVYRANNEFKIPDDAVVITCCKSYAHPKDGVMLYKVSCNGKSLVYATDKESYVNGDSRFTTFARNADLLIHDAQFTQEDYISQVNPKQGYGHSTPEMAVEAVKLANAGRLVLFHHEPSYNDSELKQIEEKTKKLYPNTIMAYEGLEIDLM